MAAPPIIPITTMMMIRKSGPATKRVTYDSETIARNPRKFFCSYRASSWKRWTRVSRKSVMPPPDSITERRSWRKSLSLLDGVVMCSWRIAETTSRPKKSASRTIWRNSSATSP